MIELLLVLVSVAMIVACGLFVAAEFSFVTVDRSSVDRDAEGGDRRAKGVRAALRDFRPSFRQPRSGSRVTNLIIGFLAEPALARLIDGPARIAGCFSGAVHGVALC